MSSIRLRNQESGLVSIIVAIVFITIIALITTSFALLSRREARQALDRQLSTQAFYAAESGINDGIKAALAGTPNKENCDDTKDLNAAKSNLGNNLSYTCVLINQNPTSLEYSPISNQEGKTVKISAQTNIGSLRISWQDAELDPSDSTSFATNGLHLLPQEGSPNSFEGHTGMLRTTIIPITNSLSRDSIIYNSQTLFMYPLAGAASTAGSYDYANSPTNQGEFVDGQCNGANTPRYCNVVITGLSPYATKTIYLRLKGIYRNASVTIQAYASNEGTSVPLKLNDGQYIIDATGKANDVLRRVQVRVPINTEYNVPDAALQSADSVCKKLLINTTKTTDLCSYN